MSSDTQSFRVGKSDWIASESRLIRHDGHDAIRVLADNMSRTFAPAASPQRLQEFVQAAAPFLPTDETIRQAYNGVRLLARNAVSAAAPFLPVDQQGNRLLPQPLGDILDGAHQAFATRLGADGHTPADEGQGFTFPPDEIQRIKDDVAHGRPIRDIGDLTMNYNALDGDHLSVKLNTKHADDARKAIAEWNKLGGIEIDISDGGLWSWWDLEIKDVGKSSDSYFAEYNHSRGQSFTGGDVILVNPADADHPENYSGYSGSHPDKRPWGDVIQGAIAHELGHSMGLDHSLPGNVMNPYTNEDQATVPGPVDTAVFEQIHPRHHAAGGDVRGPGTSIGDKIPAWLSNGEFVVNAASAAANRPLLKAINADPDYMSKFTQRVQKTVAAQLTAVKEAAGTGRGEHIDRSTTVHVTAYDVHEAFAKAKLWQQRRDLIDE